MSARRRKGQGKPTRLAEGGGPVETARTPALRSWQLFLLVFSFRVVNALTTKTFFQADEFFQCLEPAHKLVFGYGYLTWEWHEHLRSSIHPLMYATGYYLTLRAPYAVILATPKVSGAAVAAIGECYLYRFVYNYSGRNAKLATTALVASLASPFNWYVLTRSFSNNLEMVLTTVGLSYWPWHLRQGSVFRRALVGCIFGTVSCIVRPTNAILWICLGLQLLGKLPHTARLKLGLAVVAQAIAVLAVSAVADRLFYGAWTLPLYNFIEFNVVRSLSIFYGTAPWHFYLLQAVPLMTLTFLPFLIHWAVVLRGWCTDLGITAVCVLAAFLAIRHKEIRFIYPLQPILLLGIATSMQATKFRQYKRTVAFVAAFNAGISYYFTRVHERGVLDVIDYLRQDAEITSFGFLTPCHSTPWQSHLHEPRFEKTGWALSCEPPLHLTSAKEIDNYKDESDLFYEDPRRFIDSNFPTLGTPIDVVARDKKFAWPSRLVVFAPEELFMRTHLGTKYRQCKRFFNSRFHWDDRRVGDVIVYCAIENVHHESQEG